MNNILIEGNIELRKCKKKSKEDYRELRKQNKTVKTFFFCKKNT